MANIAMKRIKREVAEVMKDSEVCSIKVELVNDNMSKLKGEIAGPPDTPYEGGNFVLEIQIPESYPFDPPKVHFVTKVWHPNVSSVTGAICLNLLKSGWRACMTLKTTFISLQGLLAAPEPNDPLDAVVARQYIKNQTMFSQTASHWTALYAGGPSRIPELDGKVKNLTSMGIQEQLAVVALSNSFWDEQIALIHVFDG